VSKKTKGIERIGAARQVNVTVVRNIKRFSGRAVSTEYNQAGNTKRIVKDRDGKGDYRPEKGICMKMQVPFSYKDH
jgi:hypothetical protein